MMHQNIYDQLKMYRRDLHQIPEIGFDLPKTYQYIKSALEAMGYEPQTIAETGLYVYIEGARKDAIAFRADMDALSVTEKTNSTYASRHAGFMHACGHDGHMAILLGLAEQLSTVETFHQSVLLIFQPAEEGPGGAEVIVKTGLLEKYHVKKIFGIHLNPDLEEGKVGLVNGPMMAQNGEFDVVVKGISSHGAQPQNGRDAMRAAMTLVQNYQDIMTNMIDPFIPSIIAIGTFHAGEARNIVAQEASFTGTIRTFDGAAYDKITAAMQRFADAVSHAYELEVELVIRDFYPPVINDEALYNDVLDVVPSANREVIKPMMFAEDFSFYQEVVPGLFMMLGTKNESRGLTHPLHSCYFDFDELVLSVGVETYMDLLRFYKTIDV